MWPCQRRRAEWWADREFHTIVPRGTIPPHRLASVRAVLLSFGSRGETLFLECPAKLFHVEHSRLGGPVGLGGVGVGFLSLAP